MNTKPQLLWADDDHLNGRFRFEEKYIERKLGWNCTWAHSIKGALKALSTQEFDALILDQQLPLSTEDENTPLKFNTEKPWQGSVILYWLRDVHDRIDNTDDNINRNLTTLKNDYKPLEANKSISVLIMTSYYSDKIVEETKKASLQDATTEIKSKPIEIEDIKHFLIETIKQQPNQK